MKSSLAAVNSATAPGAAAPPGDPGGNPLLPSALRAIAAKVDVGERLDDGDALLLYRSPDLNAVGILADRARRRRHGEIATYIFNRYINYSNLCILDCQFCAFGARQRDPHAFALTIPEIVAQARAAREVGVTEIHMVGGLHPTLPATWYLEVLRELRRLGPDLQIKAFTAIEVRHLADRIFRRPLAATLAALQEAGLDALTGGGAEIFAPAVRDQICGGKDTAEEWLEVHRLWHRLGGRSTCTMLFGHVETVADRIDHLRRLRELQDETGGFTGFVPLAFVPTTTALAELPPATAVDQLRNLAVSRLYLDNIPHLTAYWVAMGLPLAQVALSYGVDDLHGTIGDEKIFHLAGATTPNALGIEALERAIRDAGFIPRQRDTFYRPVATGATAGAPPAAPAGPMP